MNRANAVVSVVFLRGFFEGVPFGVVDWLVAGHCVSLFVPRIVDRDGSERFHTGRCIEDQMCQEYFRLAHEYLEGILRITV